MTKPNIAILFGGKSVEYEVSLQSAYAVIQHLDMDKYNPILVGITRDGEWLHYQGNIDRIPEDTWCEKTYCKPAIISPCRGQSGLIEFEDDGASCFIILDAAFPVIHGTFGEDGTLQGLLELAGIPIIGCGTLASALCMDKHLAHTIVTSAGISIPISHLFHKGESISKIREAGDVLGYPLFVKPVCSGSSFGVSKVNSKTELDTAIDSAFSHDERILLESAIEGFEVGCAVLGTTELVLGELDEIELAEGFFDYTEKYNLITSKIHVPARIAADKARQLKSTAATIYKALGCKGFARVDMFLRPDGGIVFNEVNTIPGFTAHSRYPTMMKCAGIEFTELIDKLIETAVNP